MTSIGFIGLGIMGSPMSVNLVRAGHTVRGFNRTPEKGAALAEAGGTVVASIAEAVAEADIVCIMVPDSPDVEAVMLGDGAVLQSVGPGTLVIDFSTIRPDVAVSIAAAARSRGVGFLDAPVSGGEAGAIDAALSIMVGGDPRDVDRGQTVFRAVGKTIVHVGDSGAGQTVKAANQLIVAANIQALAEAVVFLEAQGVELATALDVLGAGLAGSKVLEQKRRNILERGFAPGFRLRLHHKDLGIAIAAARAAGVVTPVAALTAQLVASAVGVGDGELDHSGLVRGVERLSGRRIDATPADA
ncbi:2-hydroxy-3-oxopropionate reductase [Compostimonas suwonensis]|uniref:2-hydroxy-3-oxopropionate reductase n=1 Tax=Compostimonas suwonensis TaxID=1048394 RepID=A0A2M9BWV2_9MICO|nr:2-hydroxy-3-oxopropionate reductase [Compostimonas suwonensis]PJJ62401.1 2-hydroxy-3-oxopropionate reductase [Compostimonas suwonensis]